MDDTEIQAFFDEAASNYQCGPKPGTVEKIEFVADRATSDDLLLDVGCGSGTFMATIREETPLREVYGFDISREMLGDAENVFQGTTQNPPVSPESFQFLHLDTVLHHIVGDTRMDSRRNATRALRAAMELLAPGGLLLLTELHQVGRVIPDAVFSSLVFGGLKYTSVLAMPFAPNAKAGQPPISFYTERELEEMVADVGGEIMDRHTYTHSNYRLLRWIIQAETRRITFFIQKPE